ncbi:AraC family transcriptional regulator [Pelomonas sp. CA6]|uniref:AraC family transcriptional regulator n=1 Tax=Pelomonas sp. CA6 TaxID=2907999 RepID=UPI001F4A5E61|nr:AraC family transcriptional regulator [Pelomonas sp. CA6]MCH7342525.1 AraC family transcriptional regulator [Pelomonas sp. CA6]
MAAQAGTPMLPPGLLPAPGEARPYQLDTPLLPWGEQGVLLAEFARSRELDRADWLAAAGVREGQLLSPRQLLALLAPLADCGPDAAFVLGRAWLPGHYGLASQALQQAADAREALRLLCGHAGRLTPLLTPRLLEEGDELLLLWTDACGLPPARRGFIVDLHVAAVAGMCDWLAGERLPWAFCFNRGRPRELAHHAVHLGAALHFGAQADALRLPLAAATRPWRGQAGAAAPPLWRQALEADPAGRRRGLLAALHDWLAPRLEQAPTLDQAAAAFAVSPATLKRHLAQHGTHFQAELDQVRALCAVYLLLRRGEPSQSVARALGFFDAANFRRFFKRWTGLTPGALRR